MNAVELLDESDGACTGGNFLARSLRVKQHGAILGMQMHRNRVPPSFRDGPKDQTRNLAVNRDSGFDARGIAPE